MNSPWNCCHPTIPTILGCFATYDFQPSTFNQTCWMCHHCCQQMGLMWCHRQGRKCVAQIGMFWATIMPHVLSYQVILWCLLPTTFCCSFVHLRDIDTVSHPFHRSSTSTMYNGNVTPLTASTHPSFTMMMPPPIIDWLVPLWDHDLQVDDKKL